ncbi:MAG TPA: DsbA family protein [Xanthobacteraceae bacterium]|nr:DsbA family protein [Xanthobacteraceae bacterium]
MITRRTLLQGAAVLTVGTAFAGALPRSMNFTSQAYAQAPTSAELLQAGPLGDHALGPANAPVTLVEYASMTCSHCATFHVQTFPVLKSRYIDSGKVRYILREFPLDPLAAGAFMLAHCAGEGKYFDVVDALFKQQKSWAFAQNPIPPLFAVARQHGFNEQTFEKCLSYQKLLDGIDAVRRRAQEKFGVNSTPTFFINGKIFRGALTIEQIEREIQPFLKS